MKENWPDRAIICVPDMGALTEFVEYCEASGVMWDNTHPIRDALGFIGAYMDRRDGDVCINVEPYRNLGYCYRDYYERTVMYRNGDTKWNFCSVSDFIAWTGGYPREAAEELEVNFESIL